MASTTSFTVQPNAAFTSLTSAREMVSLAKLRWRVSAWLNDVRGAVMSRTGGSGADAVFECAGVAASFTAALPVTAARGRLVVVAIYEDELAWNPTVWMINEIEIRGSMGYEAGVYETVIDLMDQGHYPTHDWVEHIPWSAVVEEGFEPLRRGERMKVMVDVGA